MTSHGSGATSLNSRKHLEVHPGEPGRRSIGKTVGDGADDVGQSLSWPTSSAPSPTVLPIDLRPGSPGCTSRCFRLLSDVAPLPWEVIWTGVHDAASRPSLITHAGTGTAP